MAGIFKFKQFDVDQSGCAMKINTDGVLLGALTDAENPEQILDIGTGTGVIALMLAQRFDEAKIDAVEIDPCAAETAMINFNNSPFNQRLNIYPVSFEDYFNANPDKRYDLIISNPPFYINSLKSPKANKELAKHTDAAFFERLISSLPEHLKDDGSCWLILPLETAELVKEIISKYNLFVEKAIVLYSYPDSLPHRKILALSFANTESYSEGFVIYDGPKIYSMKYKAALKDFFTIF